MEPRKKIVLKISLCLTGMEQGDQGDLLDPSEVFDAIRAVALLRWPDCQVEFSSLYQHKENEQ